jgi:hypothetical protein
MWRFSTLRAAAAVPWLFGCREALPIDIDSILTRDKFAQEVVPPQLRGNEEQHTDRVLERGRRYRI